MTDYLVFGFKSFFPDDVEVTCSMCGKTGVARPHSMDSAGEMGLKPICIVCARKKKPKPSQARMTSKAKRDLERFGVEWKGKVEG